MKKFATFFPLAIISVSFLVAAFAAPHMPYLMASHWGIDGEVNGYMTKNFGLFFMPVISIILFFIFRFLPYSDPYKKNFSQFQKFYDRFLIVVFSFLFYLYLLTIFWNLGYRFNMMQFMSPSLAILFFYTGVLTQNARRNWFVGIRTPWTLSNDIVWDKTHRLGGQLFKYAAASTFLGVFFPSIATYLLFVPVLLVSFIVYLYSYIEYRRLNRE